MMRLADPLTADDLRWLDDEILRVEERRDTATVSGYRASGERWAEADLDARLAAADRLPILRRIRAALPEVTS